MRAQPEPIQVWMEPFAGGGGAGLGLLARGEVGQLRLTEKNPAICALWLTMLQDGDALAARVEATVPDMRLWSWAREVVAAGEAGQDVEQGELGFAALVVNRCSRSGMISARVGPIGGQAQAGPWRVDARWGAAGLAARIRRVEAMADRVQVSEGDGIQAVRDMPANAAQAGTLLFVDPPYLAEGNRLYSHGMTMDQHRELAAALNACRAPWLVTYDAHPEVHRLYPHREVVEYRIRNTANRVRVATEYAVLSANLATPGDLEREQRGSLSA